MSQDPPRGWEPPSSPGPVDPPPPPPSYGAPPPPANGTPPPPSYGAQPPPPAYGTPPPPPSYGTPPPPAYGAQPPPAWGQPAQQWGYGQPPAPWGYLPPPSPKPGVIPLRPLALGEILDGAVQTIRQNPKVMLGLSAIVNLALTVIVVLVDLGNLRTAFGGFGSLGASSDPETVDTGAAVASVAASLVAGLLQFIGTTVLTGLLVIAVSDAVLGKKPGIGEVWARARGRVWPLLGVTFMVGLSIFGVVLGCLLPGILVAVAGGGAVAVLLFVVGAIGALVAFFWILIRLLFAPPTVLLERTGVFASMSRSWRLVAGSWWRCLGIWLLAQLLAFVLSGVLQVPLLILAAAVGGGDGNNGLVVVLSIAAGAVARTLVAPFSAAILALLYIDLRMRREGLDVRLQQAAAA